MNTYGKLLKHLIKFTNIKLVAVADSVGYDVSYISKWINQSKLPAARSINHVNKNAASLIAEGILDEGDLDDFNTKFNQRANAENLQKIIYAMLKSGYEESFSKIQNKPSSFEKGEFVTRTYIDQDQIIDKINEIFDDIWASREPVEILCSLDILSLSEYLYGKITDVTSSSPKAAIKITAGFDTSSLDNRDYVKLYRLINKYHMISFDFYSNESFKNGNVIVIKNKMAITCSINRLGEIYILSIITDRSAVNALYSKTEGLFETQNALIESLESEKLFSKGYRTSFYASWAYRICLAQGFEFLLPPDQIENIIKQAYALGFNEVSEKMLRKLAFAWESIFSTETVDFFIPKTSLLAYIENGLLYYTDIEYKMSVDERLAHIEHVLDISKRNPNLNFYVIDDDSDQIPIETFRLSIYANINKVFLKNIARFHGPHGPQHYSILSEEMAAAIYDAIDGLKAIESCHHYDFQRLTNFIDKNRKLIDRIIFLSELANPF